MQMFSLYDAKAQEYLEPFTAAHETAAVRSIIDLLSRNVDHNRFLRHHEDYTLVRLGDFDTQHGVFQSVAPAVITSLSAIVSSMRAKEAQQ